MLKKPFSIMAVCAAALLSVPGNAQVSQSTSTDTVPTVGGTATVKTSTKSDEARDRTEERTEVKKVARDLLDRLKQLLVINWRQKSSARSTLKLAIEDVLDTGLPRAYDKPMYTQKCASLFEHFYESYPERDSGVYAQAG